MNLLNTKFHLKTTKNTQYEALNWSLFSISRVLDKTMNPLEQRYNSQYYNVATLQTPTKSQ